MCPALWAFRVRKTTITRLINGLIPGFFSGELKGTIAVDRKSILGVPMYQLSSRVGSVFQNPRTQFLMLIRIARSLSV